MKGTWRFVAVTKTETRRKQKETRSDDSISGSRLEKIHPPTHIIITINLSKLSHFENIPPRSSAPSFFTETGRK